MLQEMCSLPEQSTYHKLLKKLDGSLAKVSKNLAANLKVLALSLLMSDGVPLRAVTLGRLLRNTGPAKCVTRSRCNALEVQQV